MAPELILHGQCDARSDLYAVGIMLLEMLTLEYAYRVDVGDREAILRAHAEDAPVLRKDKNPACPEDLYRIVLKLLAKDPAERFQTAEEAEAELSPYVRVSAVPAHVVGAVLADRKERERQAAIEKHAARQSKQEAARAEEGEQRKTVPLAQGFVGKSPCAGPAPHDQEITMRQAKAPPLTTMTANVPAAGTGHAIPAWVAKPRAVAARPPEAVPPRRRRATRSAALALLVPVAFCAFYVLLVVAVKAALTPAPAPVVPSAMATAMPSTTAMPSVTAMPSAVATAMPTAVPSATAMPKAAGSPRGTGKGTSVKPGKGIWGYE